MPDRPAMPVIRIAAVVLTLTGCRQDMHDQPRYEPLGRSDFFADGRASRPLVAGTIARGHLVMNDAQTTGMQNGAFTDNLPIPMSGDGVRRGRERFDIYCSPCHGRVGDGRGMISRRGYKAPPSLHTARSRALPAGYIFSVISNGYGAMPAYSDVLGRDDRWSIVAYVRVLQFSQNAGQTELSSEDVAKLGRDQDRTR